MLQCEEKKIERRGEMKMKRKVRTSIVLMAVLGVVACLSLSALAAPISQEKIWPKVTLTYADINNEGSVQNQFARRWADAISKATEGNFIVEIYPGGILARDDMDALLQGVMDMFPTSPGMLFNYSKRAVALETPMLFKDLEHSLKILDPESTAMKSVNGDVVPAGFRILAGYNNGMRQIGTKKPIYQPSDLARLKIRVPSNINYDTFFTLAGATPITMSRSDLATALLTNVVDGMENSYHNIWGDKNHEVITYISEIDYAPGINVVVINEKSYQSLPPEYREIMSNAVKEAADWVSHYITDDDLNCKRLILEEGSTKILTEADGVKMEEFQVLGKQIQQKLTEQYGDAYKEMVDLIQSY
jgi:TRAP-type C4-dicarboxylate transport system substrate-binding protein